MTRRVLRTDRGQATVELVALLPLLSVVGLAAFAVLASRAAHEQAGAAAEAGAIAILQEREPEGAARDALPPRSRARAQIAIRGRRVVVTVRPRVPLLARLLSARITADAGPAPMARAEGFPRRTRVSRSTPRRGPLPVAVAGGVTS